MAATIGQADYVRKVRRVAGSSEVGFTTGAVAFSWMIRDATQTHAIDSESIERQLPILAHLAWIPTLCG